jgi:starch phosphorylase
MDETADMVSRRALQDLGNIDIQDPEAVQRELVLSLVTMVGRDPVLANDRDWYSALAFFLRGVLSHNLAETTRRIHESGNKRIYYLSLEYLPGKWLPKVLMDLGIKDVIDKALANLGLSLERLSRHESDMALGNGGLGRLASCFLDALATHNYPGFGYGIRYEFGLFSQSIENGQQIEHPEPWLRYGDPWQFRRPSVNYLIRFGGQLKRTPNALGRDAVTWVEGDEVLAMAYDLPVSGYRSGTVLYLRLWSAGASRDFDLRYFNDGDYIGAMREKTISESLSKVLYPNDSTSAGQELRLKQEYFFVSASLQDILRRHLKSNASLDNLDQKIAIQLNDTHPSLAVPELMRLLVDERGYDWDLAWSKVTAIFGYTCHTLLPEALETWPIAMLERVLPRHLDIIYRINQEHLERVKQAFPGDTAQLGQLSLVDDWTRRIRMAHLAVVGSRRVNGVSKLQAQLLTEVVFRGFARMDPGKMLGITNGITPRQWLLQANPQLARAFDSRIGREWPTDLDRLQGLAPLADDAAFRAEVRAIKRANKERLAKLIESAVGERVDPSSLFDIQVKRIHEYKRQLLNILHVITRYRRLKAGEAAGPARTVILGGKAAPGYEMAKRIIRLIGDVARTINSDPQMNGQLKVVFVPDYRVSLAEVIIPGADLAQHISTAGTEASGTGNMKFALNGALTLGTRDGANIEIRDAVGEENIFFFGLTAAEVAELRARGYHPRNHYDGDPDLRACLDMIGDGYFSPDDRSRHAPIRDSLLGGGDHYFLLADYRSYLDIQARVDAAFLDPDDWSRRAILNAAHMGGFSVDRAIHEYAVKIWGIKPLQMKV